MCRWQVEAEDVEVVHEVLAKHHQYLTSRPLLRLLGLQLLPLHRLVQLVVREVRVTSRDLSHIILRSLQGGGDSMVAGHWFQQIENVLEATDITSNAAKIRLAAFQLEGESQVWWDWVKTSRDFEAMTWAKFHGLFMSKYFPPTAIHAKAQEFLELRQGTMTVMEYMARFTKLARFGDDYEAIDMAKVGRFENGLKLSIRGKIVGLRLQDMDSMVWIALAIEREMDDAQGIRDASAGGKRKEDQPSSSLGLEVKASGKSHCMEKFSPRI